MRTEAEKIPVVLTVPTEATYQFDDSGRAGPYFYEWRGQVASGPTRKEAKMKLGFLIGGAVWDEVSFLTTDEKEPS